MGYEIQSETGDITTYQGDDFMLVVNGIPTDQNYKMYFAIQDSNRIPVGQEIMVESMGDSSVVFHVLAEMTDLLEVEDDAKYSTYTYAIKKCSETDMTEDTLLIGNKQIGEYNYLKVFPRRAKGTINE